MTVRPTWEPTAEDYQHVFREQNPWHIDGLVPPEWAGDVERPLAQRLWQRLLGDEPRRFHLIIGPRRVGKTTAMYQTVRRLLANGIQANRLWWLRLDHPLLMSLPLNHLIAHIITSAQATAAMPAYVFLDELTYADGWDGWLKTFYDDHAPIRLVGTSSATAELRGRRHESGVGRWDEHYLAPYLFSEYLALMDAGVAVAVGVTLGETIAATAVMPLDMPGLARHRRRFLLTGGFPELLLSGRDRANADEPSLLLQSQRVLRSDAVERAIYKDIPQVFGVDQPMLLERLLYVLAGQVTGILSLQSLGQNLGMSKPTCERYLDYLSQAFLVFALPNYSGSEVSRQKRGRKLYFVDGAVRNAALQRGLGPLTNETEMGLLLENLLASHLHALCQHQQVRLAHWRDGDDEIDLVFDHPTAPLAFEVASSATHHRGGLKAFLARYPRFAGRCWLVAQDATWLPPERTSDGIGRCPFDVALLAISAQSGQAQSERLG